jgi:large subunit ribosomal protein L4
VKATVVNGENKRVGDVELDEGIFAVKAGTGVVYDVVKMQLANRRRGSASCRNRSQVSGTTAKMYRQKGTGRARHGDYKANILVGGGKAFGPRPRDYSHAVPKKVRRGALRAALSQKVRDEKLIVVDALEFPGVKTKAFVERMKALGVDSALFVLDEVSEAVTKSSRNVPTVKVLRCEGLNVVDLLRYEHVVLTQQALAKVQEVLKP